MSPPRRKPNASMREQHQRQQEIDGYVGEPDHVRPETGARQVHGVVLVQHPVEDEPHERHAEQHADAGVDQPDAPAVGCALVHADGEALADEPGDDQHHALNAEGDEHRQQRCAGEIAQAVEGRVGGGQRQRDAGGGEQRELPVVGQRLVDAVADAVAAEQQQQHQAGEQKWIVLAYDRNDAVHRCLDIEAHRLLSQPALACHTRPTLTVTHAT